jgi:hypothetical protein
MANTANSFEARRRDGLFIVTYFRGHAAHILNCVIFHYPDLSEPRTVDIETAILYSNKKFVRSNT